MGCPQAGHCAAYGAEFFFIDDLTGKATGGELIALLILYVGTQLVSGMVMAVTADKSQRTMMFILPLVFVPFVINFPAGLVLYWITTNVWTIGQQYTIQRLVPAPHVPTVAEVQAAKPPPPPPKKRKKRR
jgi:YidC/Oxa1 family membrane protein insertase